MNDNEPSPDFKRRWVSKQLSGQADALGRFGGQGKGVSTLGVNSSCRRLFSDLQPTSNVRYTISRLMRGMLAILQRTEDRCVKYAGKGTTLPTKLLNGVKDEMVVIPI
jgi:hypothetical protein